MTIKRKFSHNFLVTKLIRYNYKPLNWLFIIFEFYIMNMQTLCDKAISKNVYS